jgi:hypothetical protein
MIWKRPRRPPVSAGREMLRDVEERIRSRSVDVVAGPLELIHERGHALVRAAMISTRRWRLKTSALCVGLPAVVFVAALALSLSRAGRPAAGWVAGAFACVWPLIAFLGAALGAGGAVVAERQDATAVQLVLTPVGKRAIAASKVLPAALPYVLGVVAALPVYVLAGGAEPLVAREAIPTPLLLWPLRMVAPILGFGPPVFNVATAATGLGMCLTDLLLVWAAAHWGAAYGVRLGEFPLLAVGMLWRLGITALYLLGCLLGVGGATAALYFTFGVVLSIFSQTLALVLVIGLGMLAFVWLWKRYCLIWPVRMVLGEFTHFDELVQDDFRPRPLRGWEILGSYGERT